MTDVWNVPHEHNIHCWWDFMHARWVCTAASPADLSPPTTATAPAKPGSISRHAFDR